MLLSSCEDSTRVQPKLVNVIDRAADKPSQTSYNTSLTFSSAGLLRAILHAGRIQTFDSKRYTYLDSSVRVDFFDKLGKHSSRLTSASAKVNSDNNMTAYGKVHIVSDSGTVVDTDSLEWHNREQTISSEAAVRIA
jgi:LPS export ABC transporter protein LptC